MTHTATAGDFIVDSVTGVDVSLPVAGVGGRSFAFIIDWHIRTLAAVAWWFSGDFIGRRLVEEGEIFQMTRLYVFAVLLPTLVIYFFYHPVLEVLMRGRTPGKRMAGVRVATRDGGTPGIGALVVRNVFRLIDALPVFYCVGMAVTLFTTQHVRIGDLAAGTLLVYDRISTRDSLESLPAALSSKLGPQFVEVIDDLLDRWKELDADVRNDLARQVLDRLEPQSGYVPDDEIQARLRAAIAHDPI